MVRLARKMRRSSRIAFSAGRAYFLARPRGTGRLARLFFWDLRAKGPKDIPEGLAVGRRCTRHWCECWVAYAAHGLARRPERARTCGGSQPLFAAAAV